MRKTPALAALACAVLALYLLDRIVEWNSHETNRPGLIDVGGGVADESVSALSGMEASGRGTIPLRDIQEQFDLFGRVVDGESGQPIEDATVFLAFGRQDGTLLDSIEGGLAARGFSEPGGLSNRAKRVWREDGILTVGEGGQFGLSRRRGGLDIKGKTLWLIVEAPGYGQKRALASWGAASEIALDPLTARLRCQVLVRVDNGTAPTDVRLRLSPVGQGASFGEQMCPLNRGVGTCEFVIPRELQSAFLAITADGLGTQVGPRVQLPEDRDDVLQVVFDLVVPQLLRIQFKDAQDLHPLQHLGMRTVGGLGFLTGIESLDSKGVAQLYASPDLSEEAEVVFWGLEYGAKRLTYGQMLGLPEQEDGTRLVTLERGTRLTGKVVHDQAQGRKQSMVQLYSETMGPLARGALTNAGGEFEFLGLDEGPYQLWVEEPLDESGEFVPVTAAQEVYVRSMDYNNVEVTVSSRLTRMTGVVGLERSDSLGFNDSVLFLELYQLLDASDGAYVEGPFPRTLLTKRTGRLGVEWGFQLQQDVTQIPGRWLLRMGFSGHDWIERVVNYHPNGRRVECNLSPGCLNELNVGYLIPPGYGPADLTSLRRAARQQAPELTVSP